MSNKRKGVWRPSSFTRLIMPLIIQPVVGRSRRNAACREGRCSIGIELELVLAEREVILAEAYGDICAEPPVQRGRRLSAPHRLCAALVIARIGVNRSPVLMRLSR